MRLYKSALLVCVLFLITAPVRGEHGVPVVESLQSEGALATARSLPILLVFSAIECGWCELLEADFLDPMSYNSEYDSKILFRKLLLDNGSRVTDFTGMRIDATTLAEQYRITVTPTIIFIDGQGHELAERMIGINTVEMFGGYLDDCIDTALSRLRAAKNLAAATLNSGCQLQAAGSAAP